MPRERKGIVQRKSHTLDGRSFFIIASEGSKTERTYFQGLKKIAKPKIEIEILERNSTASSPEHVIQQLDVYVKEYVLVEGDELWILIDRDSQSWSIKQINEIAKCCFQKKYFLALSNPCFEIWLLLHVKDISEYSGEEKNKIFENKKINKSRTAIEKELLDILGSYNKSNLDVEAFILHVDIAIKRAKKLDISPGARWINDLGTRVHLLVEKLI
ncbi:MAG TPA: RloB domain-containing protein [Bacteroidetes bacterium]|nr:RloB domain-containing protein [Bacteroidota bacterium]